MEHTDLETNGGITNHPSKRDLYIKRCKDLIVSNFCEYCDWTLDFERKSSLDKAREYHDNCVWGWQDLEALKYDPEDTWDLNFDYSEETDKKYLPRKNAIKEKGWHCYKKDKFEPSDGAMIIFGSWYDGWHYGTGYYIKDQQVVVLEDAMCEKDCTKLKLSDFDVWQEFEEPFLY